MRTHFATWRGFRKALTGLVILLLFGVSGYSQVRFTSTITGFFPKSWEGKQAMVVAKPLGKPPVIDTMTIVNRSAAFTIQLDEPCPAYLWVADNTDDSHFFIDSPVIRIGIDPVAFNKPVITGSASSELWVEQRDFLHQIRETRPELDVSTDIFTGLQAGDSLTAYRFEQMADSVRLADNALIIKLIQAHPTLPSSWYLFTSNAFSYAQTMHLFDSLSAFSAYPSYQRFREKLARKQLGRKAPDFSLPGPSGSTVTLSKLEHKYILLDFSSPYFFSCQKRHYELKKLYKTYHPLGLEIVTVSLYFDKNESGKPGVSGRLPWIEVLDTTRQSAIMESFAVEQMPDNVLLDGDKMMIGRDMSIPELEETLRSLLKK